MTGGSLGQRTSSYGSLQQQQQQTSVVLPIQLSPIVVRKPSKMVLSSSREKEKFLQRICKFAGRRRVGMLLVVVVSVVVFMSVLSAVTKDEDVPGVPDSQVSSTVLVQNNIPSGSVLLNHSEPSLTNGEKANTLLPDNVPTSGGNKANPPPPVVSGALPPGHPCKSFALPPPPADKKRIGPRPCPVCYLPVEQVINLIPPLPSSSPVLRNLSYVHEENPTRIEPFGGSLFGGYPTLQQRRDSFDIKESMNVHCGFVRGSKPGRQSGFDIDDADLLEMEQCHGIVVASAIFGNYDLIQQPKNISDAAKQNICFYMFVDRETESYMRNSSAIDDNKKVGLWRIVLVHNLPYTDARRNGKVPKLLLHRIFVNARFSIWIDGKLELVVDPYQILEREIQPELLHHVMHHIMMGFLWRKNANFAISRHYRRFDVFEEAEANKAAAKYDNASIDYQVQFYKNEGLTPYSVAKLPITSDVPEGCVIIREHVPITNLFTCLWFNEVDRFTSRDQISFSTVRDKIMSKVNWSINMFLDCERRNFVVQAYHRDLLEHMAPPKRIVRSPPPPPLTYKPPPRSSSEITAERAVIVRSPPRKRGRERRSGSRRHHPKATVSTKDTNSV